MPTPINVRELIAGARLERALYTEQGAKLAGRGLVLTEAICDRLRAHRGPIYSTFPAAFLLATEAPPLATIDDRPPEPSRDPLSFRGQIVEATPFRKRTLRDAELLAGRRALRWESLPIRVRPGAERWLSERAWTSGAAPVADGHLPHLRARLVEQIGAMLARLAVGQLLDVPGAEAVLDVLMERLERAPARFGAIAIEPASSLDHLPAHALSTCALSLLVAAALGWRERDVRIAGLAGLLSDCGMIALSPGLRTGQEPLGEIELNRVRRHPALGVALLDDAGLPAEVLRAVFQHHERENGSGYPFGLRARSIADHARVVAAADCCAAAMARRAYRVRDKAPSEAVEEIAGEARAGRLHRGTAAALVRAFGPHPAGSAVLLDDGRRARVVEVNTERVDRPVVAVEGSGEIIDLFAVADWEASIAGTASVRTVRATPAAA